MEKLIPFAAILMLLLSACSGKTDNASEAHDHMAVGDSHRLPNGDLQEVTESADVLPAFMEGKPEDMRLVYQVAANAADILAYMPCYCGCGESAGHGSNLNCFLDEIREDGSVVWDDHGTRCMVCLEIAALSVQMKQEGKSMQEIREYIDSTYGNGDYATPTDTPMPA